jgi:hypothetical protein
MKKTSMKGISMLSSRRFLSPADESFVIPFSRWLH